MPRFWLATIRKNPDINKVLVVGPNGNVGRTLIPSLLKSGYQARALQYRSPEVCDVLAARFGWPVVEQKTDWHSWTINFEKARSVLGYRPQVELLDWLRGRLLQAERSVTGQSKAWTRDAPASGWSRFLPRQN